MAVFKDQPVFDFSGGVRNDRSDLVKRDGDLDAALNVDLSDQGKVKTRLGSHMVGDTPTTNNIIDTAFFRFRPTAPLTPIHIVINEAASSTPYELKGTRITADVGTGDGTITADDTTDFAASGNIEIDGDEIAYTGKTATTFTGCTGIDQAHDSGTAVHQYSALTFGGGATLTGNQSTGVDFFTLGGEIFLNTSNELLYMSAITEFSDTGDQPLIVYGLIYRDRAYGAGTGSNRNTVFYSLAGSASQASDWPTSENFFRIATRADDDITGQVVSSSDELLIFLMNSFFSYNEVQLKQRSDYVGAYNNKVIVEIDGLIYTFCPSGVWRTNGRSLERISDPVQEYLKDFRPSRPTISSRAITNTFATKFDKKYLLYIGDVTSADTLNDVSLVFDTETDTWTVWNGFTDFKFLKGMSSFLYGGFSQQTETLFGGGPDGKLYRYFSKSYLDADVGVQFRTGGDLYPDLLSDGASTPIDVRLRTKFYDQGAPHIYKQFRYVRAFSDNPGWQLFFRVEGERGVSDWIPLGEMKNTNQRFPFPEMGRGYRVQFEVVHSDPNVAPEFHGLIIQDTIQVTKEK